MRQQASHRFRCRRKWAGAGRPLLHYPPTPIRPLPMRADCRRARHLQPHSNPFAPLPFASWADLLAATIPCKHLPPVPNCKLLISDGRVSQGRTACRQKIFIIMPLFRRCEKTDGQSRVETYNDVFREETGQRLIKRGRVRLVVFDPIQEEISFWTN